MNFSGQESSFSVLHLPRAVKISKSWNQRRCGWYSAPVICLFIPVMLVLRKETWAEPPIHICPGPNCLSHSLTHYVILVYQIFFIYLIYCIWLMKCHASCTVAMLGLTMVCGTSLWERAKRLALSPVFSTSAFCLSVSWKTVIWLCLLLPAPMFKLQSWCIALFCIR